MSTTTPMNRQWRLLRRPVGLAKAADFEWHEAPVPQPGPGQLLVKNEYLSVDPIVRAWMWHESTDLPAQSIGDVMRGITFGVVQRSNDAAWPAGTPVMGALGWQDYSVIDADSPLLLSLADVPEVSPEMHLGLLGYVGLTAYFGLLEIGRPQPGDTLVISSAAGAVGSLVGQIGKLLGCRVIGIAGSDAKCRWITGELGFDAAINYKMDSVFRRLRELCPEGIDIYFDNVGGSLLEDAIHLLDMHARVVVCGMVSLYNDVGGMLTFPAGPNNLLNLMLKRARMEGFVCLDYRERAREAMAALMTWHREGRIRYRVNVIDGLRQAPRALGKAFDGTNSGKLVVKM